MAAYRNTVTLGDYVATINVTQKREIIASNGYDADKVLIAEDQEVMALKVSAPDIDGLKKRVQAVLEGGL